MYINKALNNAKLNGLANMIFQRGLVFKDMKKYKQALKDFKLAKKYFQEKREKGNLKKVMQEIKALGK